MISIPLQTSILLFGLVWAGTMPTITNIKKPSTLLRTLIHLAGAMIVLLVSVILILISAPDIALHGLFLGAIPLFLFHAYDRETRVIQSPTPTVKQYRFILPYGPYNMSISEWIRFIITPQSYMIEYHGPTTLDNKEQTEPPAIDDPTSHTHSKHAHKLIFKYTTPQDFLSYINTDEELSHHCHNCSEPNSKYASLRIYWGEQTKENEKLCMPCYTKLLDTIEAKTDSVEIPLGPLLAEQI